MNMNENIDLIDRPLSSFSDLGKVAVNRLAENKTITVKDLLKLSKRDLLYIPGFGPKSIDQILRFLKKYNLKIRDR